MDRTKTRPRSAPDTHMPRQKPSRRARYTTAHASSRTSRRSVCSHDSSPSGRPPGQPHRSPSVLIRTTSLSRVTQNALAPWFVPSGSASAGCHSMNQVPPFDRQPTVRLHRLRAAASSSWCLPDGVAPSRCASANGTPFDQEGKGDAHPHHTTGRSHRRSDSGFHQGCDVAATRNRGPVRPQWSVRTTDVDEAGGSSAASSRVSA